MQWYYVKDGERHGPVEDDEFRRLAADGEVQPNDHVWNEAMGQQWAPASSIPGLFDETPPAATGLVPAAIPEVAARHLGGDISCSAPVSVAWQRMKIMLFRPFDLGKWFTLGVSAWLASLGEGGGSSFSGNLGDFGKQRGGRAPGQLDFNEIAEPVREFFTRFGGSIALIVAAALIIFVAIALVVTWLRARGKFMFIDNVVANRSEISGPWRVFTQHGNSLFWWSVLYGLACLVVFAVLLGVGFLTVVLPCIRAQTFVRSTVPVLILLGVVWLIIAVALAYVSRFVEDFVIPLMHHFDLTVMEAWGRFGTLFKAHTGAFVLYGLFYLLLGFLAGLCVLLFVVATCCIGGCLMAIPYVGAVVMLPVSVFFRAYSVEYLAQFGPKYRLFPDEQEAGA